MKSSIHDREQDKFRPAPNDLTRVAVTLDGELVDINVASDVHWDKIERVSVSSLVDDFNYYLGTQLKRTIKITFKNSCKEEIEKIEKFDF